MIAALIITCGKTEPPRGGFAPQKELGTIPAIRRIVLTFQRAGVERIVMVCSGEDDEAEKLSTRLNVVFIHNPAGVEMLDNVKAGLAYLQGKCTAALITHTDIPLFSVETVRALMEEAEGDVCVPSHNGTTGHPILLRSERFPAVSSYYCRGGLSGVVKALGLQRRLVEVDDEGILVDSRCDTDLEHLIAGHSLQEPHPGIKLTVVKEKPCYGPGLHLLLYSRTA